MNSTMTKIFSYENVTSFLGDDPLRTLVLRSYFPDHSRDNVAIANSKSESLSSIFMSHIEPGFNVLTPIPGPPLYSNLVEAFGGEAREYSVNLSDLDECLINWDEVEKYLDNRTCLLVLNSPHNPSGRMFTKMDIARLIEVLNLFPRLMFVMDESFRDIVYHHKVHYDFSLFLDRGYLIGNFNSILPKSAPRYSWIVSQPWQISNITSYLPEIKYDKPLLDLRVIEAVKFNQQSQNVNLYANFIIAKEILDFYDVDYTTPQGSHFFLIKYDLPEFQVVDELCELGIDVMPGSYLGLDDDSYVRVSIFGDEAHIKNVFSTLGNHWNQK